MTMAEAATGQKIEEKAYDVKFKLRAIDVTKRKSISSASRQFGVNRKRIREWIKQDSELTLMKKEGKSKSKHVKGGG
jgi:transposase-like protein